MKAIEHLNNQNNLPDFMKDFHDQKDLFKTIWSWWGKEIEDELNIKWVNAMIFTIDKFLWFMGLHGYKLQKDRTKDVDFFDISDSMMQYEKKSLESLNNLLSEEITK